MALVKLYKDLIFEIEAYEDQLSFAEDTKRELEKLLNIRKPAYMRAMAFDSVGHVSRDDTTMDRLGQRYNYTVARIEAYRDILGCLKEQQKKIQDKLDHSDGLKYKIYARRLKGMSYMQIAEELGYSEAYLVKVFNEK